VSLPSSFTSFYLPLGLYAGYPLLRAEQYHSLAGLEALIYGTRYPVEKMSSKATSLLLILGRTVRPYARDKEVPVRAQTEQ
jgi:hypothetical protein